MQIDRRITNGLAWAGAALVVAVPLADFVTGQLTTQKQAQVALVETAVVAPLPAPASQRPHAVAARPTVTTPAAPAVKPVPVAAPQPDPVTTASTDRPASGSGDAVDAFLKSGRALPSYISDAPSSPAASTDSAQQPIAVPASAVTVPTQPATAPVAAPTTVTVAAVAPARVAPMPMPASMRPATPAPVLIVDEPAVPVVTPDMVSASDLEDWESGPLSEFLARRQQQGGAVLVDDYDPDGFFLDQGPNSEARMRVVPIR